jgi:hypothetical protein
MAADQRPKTQPAPAGKKKAASPDALVKGGKGDKPELTEDELKDVAGGGKPIHKAWAGS